MKLYGIVGWKNAGKTTLVERLLAETAGRGLRVSTVKHAHHGFEIDRPGKDSFRHRAAGAHEVLVLGGQRWALMHELAGDAAPPLAALLARLSPVDLVLVEGFKRDSHPKIEVWRGGAAPLAMTDETVRALASPQPPPGLQRPWLALDDIPTIADFILGDLALR
ncbi:MAG: molybdopterin-guanine dinucleotide biosynthesis protein B [Pseudomonadota bacterium]